MRWVAAELKFGLQSLLLSLFVWGLVVSTWQNVGGVGTLLAASVLALLVSTSGRDRLAECRQCGAVISARRSDCPWCDAGQGDG